MLILLIDNENICTDTNFIDLRKYIVSFLDIGKSLLLGNVLILCIFFVKYRENFQCIIKKAKYKQNSFQNLVVFSVWMQ